MKKLIVVVCLLMLVLQANVGQGQTFYNAPSYMVQDTLSSIGQTRATRDFFFVPANDSAGVKLNYGIFDFIIEADMWSTIETADTLTLEAYGLVRVRNKISEGHATEGWKTWALDSTYLGTMPVSTTESADMFPIETEFTNWLQYDGVRIVIKLGGTDADSVKTWSQVRGYIPSVVE